MRAGQTWAEVLLSGLLRPPAVSLGGDVWEFRVKFYAAALMCVWGDPLEN